MQANLKYFFEPESVAIVGASSNPRKLSFGVLKNISQYGYKGSIFPINPKSDEILGFQCYKTILDVPEAVDLAVIILPASMTLDVLKQCGEKGVKACIIISGGFKELGSEGKQREVELMQVAEQYGIRIIGPNCVGNVNIHSGLNTTFIKGLPKAGGIAFVSQSGAVCGGVVDHVLDEGIGFSHLISLGNEMDVTETDMLDYLAYDDNTSVIALYVESIRDGARFLEVAREVTRKKPIVLLKAGKSESGAKAVSSHTGSLAGSRTAYTTALKQAGVIEVNSLRSLLQTALALDMQPLPKNDRAVIFTNAGGPAALLSDSMDAQGIKLETLDEKVQAKLAEKLNPSAQTMNPIDILGGANEDEYAHAIRTTIDHSQAGVLLPVLVPQALVNPLAVAEAFVNETKDSGLTTLACLVGKHSIADAKHLLHENMIPVLDYPEDVGQVLGAMRNYREVQKRTPLVSKVGKPAYHEKAREYMQGLGERKQIGEADTRPLMELAGIPNVKGAVLNDLDAARQYAQQIGYPVVLKIVSDDILHKSDAGGIRLNIQDAQHLELDYQAMMRDVHNNVPNAQIVGVLVEKMYQGGEEVIVGMKRDDNFGPMLMFGMGGIYVEAFKDVSFRIAPMAEDEIREMIMETAAGRILSGLRGVEYDIDSLVKVLKALAELSIAIPQIKEIEINPLKVMPRGEGVVALDSRMILD